MEQLELNLQQAKQEIREEMAKTAQSFIVIGYRLRQILDSGAYIQDGYNDFNEFAKKEFGLSQSGTSRFISINKNYSENGFGAVLREEYRGYSCSQLTEMLSLSEDDRELVTEEMPVAQIREVKDFVREENKLAGQTSLFAETIDARALYLEMFKGKAKELRHLLEDEMDEKEVCETINPAGSKVFRYKTVMVIMAEQVTIRVFGGNQEKITYMDFLHDVRQNLTLADAQEKKCESEKPKNVDITLGEGRSEAGKAQEKKYEAEKPKNVDSTLSEGQLEEANDTVPEHAAGGELDHVVDDSDKEPDPVEAPMQQVERVEGEVVEDKPALDESTMRGYKAAMSSQIRQLGHYLDEENWQGMKKVAEDIVWRAGKILGEA